MCFSTLGHLCLLARREKAKNLTGEEERWGLRSLSNCLLERVFFRLLSRCQLGWLLELKLDTVKLKEAQLCIHHPKNRQNLSKLWVSLLCGCIQSNNRYVPGLWRFPKEHTACVFCTVFCSFSQSFLSYLEFLLCCLPGFFLIPVCSRCWLIFLVCQHHSRVSTFPASINKGCPILCFIFIKTKKVL